MVSARHVGYALSDDFEHLPFYVDLLLIQQLDRANETLKR